MKRLTLALIVWLVLALPCAASTIITNYTQNGSGFVTSATVTVPTTQNNDKLILCAGVDNGAVITFPGAFSAITGSGLPVAGSTWANCVQRTSASEPASYSISWTGSAHPHWAIFNVHNTDGTVPVLDVSAGTFNNAVTSLNAASVTTTQNNDVLLYVGWEHGTLSGAPVGVNQGTLFDDNGGSNQGMSAFYSGLLTAGASAALNFPTGISNAQSIITISIKSNTTTAALFTGVGAENQQSGAATIISIATPSNGNANDALIAAIEESTTGVVITAPPVIALRGTPTIDNSAASTSRVVGVPVGTISGDMETAYILSLGTPTLPACACWTLVLHGVDTFGADNWVYSHTAGGSEPATYTWTIAGNNLFTGSISTHFDSSGGTLLIGNSVFLAGAAATSFQSARLTTAHNNAMIWNYWEQAALATITLPTTQNTGVVFSGQGNAIGWFNLHTAGLTATQTATSGSSAAWRSFQVEIYSTAAAALSASTAWTHQTPFAVTDPASTNQLDLYWMVAANAEAIGPSLFTFASSEATSDGVMSDWSNLDATTPLEACAPLATGGMANPMAPSTTPTSADELLFYAVAPSVGFATTILTSGGANNRIGLGYGPLSGAGAQSSGGSNTNPFVTFKCGLKAATTPTRTTAHALTNFEALEIFTSTLPVATSNGGWFF